MENKKGITIDAAPKGEILHYRDLNKRVRLALKEGYNWIVLKNVLGQRFIGSGIKGNATIEIFGDAGLDLGVFSEGLRIIVHGSSEYLLGNTLSGGELIVYGDSWDVTGMCARDGRIFVMGNGGSRIGIHMKEFRDKKPAIVYGGAVKQYCGEYMAGGIIVILGLDFKDAIKDKNKPVDRGNIDPKRIKNLTGDIVQGDLAAGIHGGTIYVRGDVSDKNLGVYAVKDKFTEEDKKLLEPLMERFSELFNVPMDFIFSKNFTKIRPVSSRPFGKVFTSTPI